MYIRRCQLGVHMYIIDHRWDGFLSSGDSVYIRFWSRCTYLYFQRMSCLFYGGLVSWVFCKTSSVDTVPSVQSFMTEIGIWCLKSRQDLAMSLPPNLSPLRTHNTSLLNKNLQSKAKKEAKLFKQFPLLWCIPCYRSSYQLPATSHAS